MDTLMIAALVALATAVFVVRSLVVVPRDHAFVVERLGRYTRTLRPGLHVLTPFLDTVRRRHALGETAVPIEPVSCITRDNYAVTADGTLHLAVADPHAATYAVADHVEATVQAARTALRTGIGTRTFDEVRTSGADVGRHVQAEADRTATSWGVKVTACEITVARG